MFNPFKSKARAAGSPSGLNAAQAAGALAAIELHQLGNIEAAEKMLSRHGLTLEVAQSYAAAVRQAETEAEDTAEEAPAASAGGAEWMTVNLPNGYADTVGQRAKLIALLWAQHGEGWQIESFDKEALKAVAVRGAAPDHRPSLQKMILNDDFKASATSDLASFLAEVEGVSLVACNHFAKTALTAAVPPATVELRNRLAQSLKIRPWDEPDGLEISLEFGPLGKEFGITKLTVFRFPTAGTAEKRKEVWLELVRSLVAYVPKTQWQFEDRLATTGELVLTRALDPLLGILPYPVDAKSTYTSIPFGVDENLQPLSLGLLEMNQLLGGLPGGGKSGGLTTLITGISQLRNVALIGLDPKEVELQMWEARFSRIEITLDGASEVLTLLLEEMGRRYAWLRENRLKKFTPEQFSSMFPLLVVVIDELAELVAAGATADEKKGDTERALGIRRLIAKGRAAGIVVITATQKPASDVIPTGLRDLIQLRVAYATTNADMTDTILGKGMGQMGGLAHEIPAYLRGACYVISETSRTPLRARTYWVPDEDVAAIAESTAHLRVDLPWLNGLPGAFPSAAAVMDLGEMTFDLDDLEMEPVDLEDSVTETEESVAPAWAASVEEEDKDPFATAAPAKVSPALAASLDEDDPFAEPAVQKKSAVAQADAFDWG